MSCTVILGLYQFVVLIKKALNLRVLKKLFSGIYLAAFKLEFSPQILIPRYFMKTMDQSNTFFPNDQTEVRIKVVRNYIYK